MLNRYFFLRMGYTLAVFALCVIAYAAGSNYKGNVHYYTLFTVVANALLINGLRRNALFFDTFIGAFLWLGFWLKYSLRIALNQPSFRDVLAFDGSPEAFDRVLIISSCGLAAFILSSLVRSRFFVYPIVAPSCQESGLFLLYRKYRLQFVLLFLVIVVLVALSNAWLGIYQRGMVAHTVLPFGLNGIYKWLLQFGLASISALIIRYEIELNRNISFMAVIPPLLEGLFSNVSLLSRGMVLNASALGLGALRLLGPNNVRRQLVRITAISAIFFALFVTSVLAVNILRATSYEAAADNLVTQKPRTDHPNVVTITHMTVPLFLDRWVGIEGVVAVSAYSGLGWDLWREAWLERMLEGEMSIYDRKFIDSPYKISIDKSQFHFVSLPGIVAFLYFPGSLIFLFLAIMFCGWIGAAIEIGTYRFAGQNWVLCSLVAQVVAYRFIHFGYVPAQSYMLFGTLLLNVAIIYGVDRFVFRIGWFDGEVDRN
jgi:hypothetical protein